MSGAPPNLHFGAIAIKLGFTTQPGDTKKSTDMADVIVAVQDAFGNTVTTDNATQITLAIGTNPATPIPGVLSSVNGLVLTVVNGEATFSLLQIDKSANGYTLVATSSPVLTQATSTTFNITP